MNRRSFLSHSAGAFAAGAVLPNLSLAAAAGSPVSVENSAYAPRPRPKPVVKPG